MVDWCIKRKTCTKTIPLWNLDHHVGRSSLIIRNIIGTVWMRTGWRQDSIPLMNLDWPNIYIYIFTEFSNNWSLCAHQFGPPVVRWQKKSSNYMMKWLFQSGLNNQAISCLKLHPYLAFLSVNKSASETWVYVPEVWRVGLLYIAHAGNSGSEFRIRSRSRFCKLEWKKIFGGGG